MEKSYLCQCDLVSSWNVDDDAEPRSRDLSSGKVNQSRRKHVVRMRGPVSQGGHVSLPGGGFRSAVVLLEIIMALLTIIRRKPI